MDAKKNKKGRRTNSQLEQDMMNAIENLVRKKGFSDIPLIEFVHEAEIDPNVFYRRYKTLEDIYDTLAKKNDFWINNNIDISELHASGDQTFLINGIKKLQSDLGTNPVMQKLLLWELSDINKTTKHSAQLRDTMNSNLILYYKQIFREANFDIAAVIALLIGGIYYLTLYRGIATFCLIDFSSEEGKKTLNSTINSVVEMLFDQLERQKKKVFMAKEMEKDGITHKNICKYMGITAKELKFLLQVSDSQDR